MGVVVGALLLAGLVIRTAVVLAFAEQRPDIAARLWPNHPRVVVQAGLAEIGAATARGQPPSPHALDSIRQVAARDPLAAEPFMVEGTRALSAGRTVRAEALLREAVARDPRLPAPRFLLANLYLKQGRTRDGLRQIGALIRRLPKAAAPLTPAIAAFARQPGAVDQVRAILARNPDLRGKVLASLAEEPDHSRLVLALAGREPTPGDWQARLIASLVERGNYTQAHQLWLHFSGLPVQAVHGLFNPTFDRSAAPPPFNWQLLNGAAGVAEPAPSGGLTLLYFGREEAVLASQLLLLEPGRYRLTARTEGLSATAGQLVWTIACLPGASRLGRQPLPNGALDFLVPPSGCPAQELQLRGEPAEMPANVSLTLKNLRLSKEAAR